MERTTNLEMVIDGAEFTWGVVSKIYEVGPYAVVEYNPWVERGNEVRVGLVDSTNTKHLFHCYADGRSLSRGATTLEGALAFCMAYKHDPAGPNSQAAHYFCKMIEVAS